MILNILFDCLRLFLSVMQIPTINNSTTINLKQIINNGFTNLFSLGKGVILYEEFNKVKNACMKHQPAYNIGKR